MAVQRSREADDGGRANAIALALVAILTLAVIAMIAFILIANANDEGASRTAALFLAISGR